MKTVVALAFLLSITLASCGSVASFDQAQSAAESSGLADRLAAKRNMDRAQSSHLKRTLIASNGLAKLDQPFQVPIGNLHLQATIAYRAVTSGCSRQALMVISIDGQEAWRAIVKTTPFMTATNLFVDYTYPVPSTLGQATLHVEADEGCKSD